MEQRRLLFHTVPTRHKVWEQRGAFCVCSPLYKSGFIKFSYEMWLMIFTYHTLPCAKHKCKESQEIRIQSFITMKHLAALIMPWMTACRYEIGDDPSSTEPSQLWWILEGHTSNMNSIITSLSHTQFFKVGQKPIDTFAKRPKRTELCQMPVQTNPKIFTKAML